MPAACSISSRWRCGCSSGAADDGPGDSSANGSSRGESGTREATGSGSGGAAAGSGACVDRILGCGHVAAGEFKQRCLALLDAVAESHEPLTITKHGKPVARLVPLESDMETELRILAQLRAGDGAVLVDEATVLQPTASLAGWKAD